MDLRPGASGAHSSWPKYEKRAPVATTSVSYGIGPPSASVISRRSEVDAHGRTEQDRRVPLATQDRAQRLGDLARGQGTRRDLVQERLEEVEVAPIDERHLDPRRRRPSPWPR